MLLLSNTLVVTSWRQLQLAVIQGGYCVWSFIWLNHSMVDQSMPDTFKSCHVIMTGSPSR